jgi:hypothetical protein
MAVAGKLGTIGDGVNRIDVDDDSFHKKTDFAAL